MGSSTNPPLGGVHPVDGSAISKKHAKRLRQEMDRGLPVLGADEYKRRRQGSEQNERRNRQILQQKRLFPVPADLERDKLEEYAPGICRDLREHKLRRTTQSDSRYRARAIWFNDFDNRHSFGTKHRQARLLYGILVQRLIKGETLHTLELLFVAGCLERVAADQHLLLPSEQFKRREAFVKAWLQSECDLYIFTKSDTARFKRMRQDLRARLMDVKDKAAGTKFTQAHLMTFAEELPTVLGVGEAEEDPDLDDDGGASEDGGENEECGSIEAYGSTWQEILADYDKIKDIALMDSASCAKASALLDRLQADKDGADVQDLVEKALQAAADGSISQQSMYVVRK